MGVDRKLHTCLTCPTLLFDFLDPSNMELISSLIASPFCIYVHFAPPCGTASRACLIKRRRRYNLPVVRTDRYPNGIPGLAGALKTRVELANELYEVTCKLILICEEQSVPWLCEHFGRSFMWQTARFEDLLRKAKHFQTTFHHCRYGAGRCKLTHLAYTVPTFADLELRCQNDCGQE